MGKKYFLNLLILCAILVQEIASLSEVNTEGSSDVHIRKKRLIGKIFPQKRGISFQYFRQIVNILRSEVSHCVGSILLPTIVIAPASCFQQTGTYTILAGSTQRNRGIRHNISMIIRHQKFNPLSYDFDLALVKINPPVGKPNQQIERTYKPLLPHSAGYITGWGCMEIGPKNEIIISNELKLIEMRTIQYFQCQRFYNLYGERIPLTMHHFCTYDPSNHKRSCAGGTPFIKNGLLAGIMPYRENSVTHGNPQVFLDLGHPDIKQWIDLVSGDFSTTGK